MGYWKTDGVMGTATLTKSQKRRTRSASKTEVIERGFSSPLEILQGSSLRSSSRKTITSASVSFDKENAPPSVINFNNDLNAHTSSGSKVTSEHILPKTGRKRKQSARDLQPLCNIDAEINKDASAVSAENGSIENPVNNEQNSRAIINYSGLAEISSSANERHGGPNISSSVIFLHQGQQQKTTRTRNSDEIYASRNATTVSSFPDVDDAPQNGNPIIQEAGALSLLQRDYEKLYKKYQKLKNRKFEEVEALYEEQNARISAFVQATEALVEYYKGENVSLQKKINEANIPELLEKCNSLEKANIDCRKDLVEEQSKSLELRQEIKRLKSLLFEHVANKQQSHAAEPVIQAPSYSVKTIGDCSALSGHSKLVQQLLECVLGLELSIVGDGVDDVQLHFRHNPTGFAFILRAVHDMEIAELVGGGELMYQNVSLGVCRKAVDWMKEKEVIFGMDQAQILFRKLIRFFNRGIYG